MKDKEGLNEKIKLFDLTKQVGEFIKLLIYLERRAAKEKH